MRLLIVITAIVFASALVVPTVSLADAPTTFIA